MLEESGGVGLGEVLEIGEVVLDRVVVPPGGSKGPAQSGVGHVVVCQDVDAHALGVVVGESEFKTGAKTIFRAWKRFDEGRLDAGTERAVKDIATSSDDARAVDDVMLLVCNCDLQTKTFGAVVDESVLYE